MGLILWSQPQIPPGFPWNEVSFVSYPAQFCHAAAHCWKIATIHGGWLHFSNERSCLEYICLYLHAYEAYGSGLLSPRKLLDGQRHDTRWMAIKPWTWVQRGWFSALWTPKELGSIFIIQKGKGSCGVEKTCRRWRRGGKSPPQPVTLVCRGDRPLEPGGLGVLLSLHGAPARGMTARSRPEAAPATAPAPCLWVCPGQAWRYKHLLFWSRMERGRRSRDFGCNLSAPVFPGNPSTCLHGYNRRKIPGDCKRLNRAWRTFAAAHKGVMTRRGKSWGSFRSTVD